MASVEQDDAGALVDMALQTTRRSGTRVDDGRSVGNFDEAGEHPVLMRLFSVLN